MALPQAGQGRMLNAAREAAKRGPDPGRRDRAESMANPTHPQLEWVMNHMKEEIRIEAPVGHVWAFLCDTSRQHDFASRAETSDWSGPFDRVGTTYVEKMKMMGFESKVTHIVVEAEPLKLIHEHTDQGPIDTFYRFEPEGGATRLIIESVWEMPAFIPGFFKSLMTKNWVERNVRQMLEDFKALAEATVPAHA